MIYFDNAATTWPKPQSVINALVTAMSQMGANPGRSGHKMSVLAGEKVFECRELLAEFFGVENPCNVIFTFNATHSLNLVIGGILNDGDHVICTQMDHNSSLRPIHNTGKDIGISIIPADSRGSVDISKLEEYIKPNTRLIVMSHISNVCGTIQDAAQVGKTAKKHGIPFLLDASQSAGILDINITRDNIDFLALPGHKGLYGPMGTGVLCINSTALLKPVISGGTGSNSHELLQPTELPDMLESGTLNFPGICGLEAGVRFVKSVGTQRIFNHEKKLTEYFLEGISEIKNYKIVGKPTTDGRNGVISFVHKSVLPGEICRHLDSSYNIAARSMYQCAYPSHEALGTSEQGTVRISFGIFNTIGQVKTLLYALEHL